MGSGGEWAEGVKRGGASAPGDDGNDLDRISGCNHGAVEMLGKQGCAIVFHHHRAVQGQQLQQTGDGAGLPEFMRGAVQNDAVGGGHGGERLSPDGGESQKHAPMMA